MIEDLEKKKSVSYIRLNEHPKSMSLISEKVYAGFSMTFANGNTISVQFGNGNYCSNRFKESKPMTNTAEILITNEEGEAFDFNYGKDGCTHEVKGWCSANTVARWINFAANYEF